MNSNYIILAIVAVAIVILMAFIIRRNKKDVEQFKKEESEADVKPDKHNDLKV